MGSEAETARAAAEQGQRYLGKYRGTVTDNSEQLVIGASLAILDTPNNPDQWDDPGLNPIILIPIPDEIDTCEELMAIRDALFPPEPAF